ncbi:extracellular solute-binding protein [Paenibacillus sp. HB172176]|uniref:extracellular solute-binding protein n=1 Tax=Paenibacillus sp. HB172176 TaxID=2493690 RepID=UPI001438DA1A|nr:extracellular solute-binding protein [Paenibacillus sp. HB172176]
MNTKQKLKWITFASAVTLAVTGVAGCSNNVNSSNAPEQTVRPSTDTEGNQPSATQSQLPPQQLSIMLPAFSTSYPKDGTRVLAEIEKRTNTKIHIDWIPNSSYGDKFNIILASGKLPSIMFVSDAKNSSFVNAAKSGAFWDLGPYLKDYDNLSQANEVILNNSSIDGKNYGIYRARPLGRNGINYRKDWLENVGLPVPQTIDDFYNMLKAFKEKDPDQNGKDDTYGMVLVKWTGVWASGFDIIKLWFGVPNQWGIVNGELVPEHETPEYLEALKFMRKLYEEGLINHDFAVYDSSKWIDPIVNNQAGVIVDVTDTARRIDQKIHTALQAENKDEPDKQFVDNLIGVEGEDGLKALPTSGFSGMFVIPKSTVKTEDELKRVLEFLDQTNDADIQTLLYSGIEGIHYTKENDYIVPTTDKTMADSELTGLGQLLTYIPEDRTLKSKSKMTPLSQKTDKLQKEAEKYIVPNPAEPFASEVYTERGPQLNNIINDARIKFIVGQYDKEDVKAAFELWRKSGGDDYVKEMNTLYAASQK